MQPLSTGPSRLKPLLVSYPDGELSNDEQSGDYVEEISLNEHTKMELPRSKVGSVWVTGTPDPAVPMSDVPCPGCGAMLQCQRTRKPGFIASEVRRHKLE